MCVNHFVHNPKFREALAKSIGANTEKKKDPVKEQQKQTAQSIQNFGLMGAFAAPQLRQQLGNDALKVRTSGMLASTVRNMNRKG